MRTIAKVASQNFPHRLDRDGSKRRANFTRMAKDGITVIAVQEITDRDIFRIHPAGWGHWRPAKSESAGIMWNPAVWTPVAKGRRRINSKDWSPVREIVWVRLRNRRGNERTFASVHLVAFKDSKPRNGVEFRKQVKRCASWLSHQPVDTVLMGDFNGTPDDGWMEPLERVAAWSVPLYQTGPEGQRIDYGFKRREARTRARAIRRWPKAGSDHYGVVLDV